MTMAILRGPPAGVGVRSGGRAERAGTGVEGWRAGVGREVGRGAGPGAGLPGQDFRYSATASTTERRAKKTVAEERRRPRRVTGLAFAPER